jgi:GGDEF domain-containing protein
VATTNAIVFSPTDTLLPGSLSHWLASLGVPTLRVGDPDELVGIVLRGRPRLVIIEARHDSEMALGTLRRLKVDSYTAVVPTVVVVPNDGVAFGVAFDAGADEVIRAELDEAETSIRMDAVLRRSDRDLYVHPSTRLPGAVEIEAEISRRLARGQLFGMCYADLDHFKEFNDRYSYYEGDRVIRILAQILHDVVKGMCHEDGFVGHIGGDDFIFIVPVGAVAETCSVIVDIFDTLVPLQYSEQDRRAGYFFGKDRRGQLHRVPLMTVSIGVVTNERRHFTHAAQVSVLATEMKSYAKTLPGSVYSIDRRADSLTGDEVKTPMSSATLSGMGREGK